jgi:hypothetical protein
MAGIELLVFIAPRRNESNAVLLQRGEEAKE